MSSYTVVRCRSLQSIPSRSRVIKSVVRSYNVHVCGDELGQEERKERQNADFGTTKFRHHFHYVAMDNLNVKSLAEHNFES